MFETIVGWAVIIGIAVAVKRKVDRGEWEWRRVNSTGIGATHTPSGMPIIDSTTESGRILGTPPKPHLSLYSRKNQ